MNFSFLQSRAFKSRLLHKGDLDWRESQGLNQITRGSNFALGPATLNLPQSNLILDLYPHSYHGMAKDGSVLYIERLGLMSPELDET